MNKDDIVVNNVEAIKRKSKVRPPSGENDYHRFKEEMGRIDYDLGLISKEEYYKLARNRAGEDMNNQFNAGFKDWK